MRLPDWQSEDGVIQLYKGDCLEVMPELEPGIDMIAADLPYGTTTCKWDTVIPLAPLWENYKRIIKRNGAVVLTSSQPFTSALVMSNVGWFRNEWIWEKSRPSGFMHCNTAPLKSHESVCIFARGQTTYHPQMQPATLRKEIARRISSHEVVCRTDRVRAFDNNGKAYPRTVLRIANPNHANLHRTEKPVVLFEYLIRTYTNEGETVLDNTMGSGTTGVACVNTDRKFIGIEKDEAYFGIAVGRIEKAISAKSEHLQFA